MIQWQRFPAIESARRRRRALAALALLAAVTVACGPRSRPAVQLPSGDLARADELVRAGCYECLLEARDIYRHVSEATRESVLQQSLETQLLLALREKELALDATPTIAEAKTLAARAGARTRAGDVVELVDRIPPDSVGTPQALRQLPWIVGGRGAREQFIDEALATIHASTFTPLFRQYLELAIACEIGRAPETIRLDDEALAAVPLIAYRHATCSNPIDAKTLEQLRTQVDRFHELSLFLGRAEMSRLVGSDGTRVRTLFEQAYARFPNSPAVTFHLATVYEATGDCRTAEQFFTETVALREGHEAARLGRAICRTYLGDPSGAITDASVLIDASAYNRGEAYYWRAWNRRGLKQLALARSDIEAARALIYNARVLTLAGMIEHDQQEFGKARSDLSQARDLDARECQARWYLGLVGYSTEEWAESAAGFAGAADCYAQLIAETEAQRDAMIKRTDVSKEFQTRQVAGFNSAIAEDSTQRSAADLNAAINYARAGDIANATTYMKRAWVDPERRTVVEDLRQVLGVPRWQ